MKEYNRFSPRASLVAIGTFFVWCKIWDTVTELVHIQQKTIKHSPLDKLCDAFINILAGGQGVVEIGTRVEPDKALQSAFGRSGCADQSGVSQTLNACDAQVVGQMRQALRQIYRRYGQGYRHAYQLAPLVLDVDTTGMVAGVQAEGATKGYLPEGKNRRGRQLGRVFASDYDEIVFEKLYSGTTQLERSLQELVLGAAEVLELSEERRNRTIIRVDGGGGRDADIDWLLEQGYLVLVKVKNWKRSEKLGKSVTQWFADPKVPDRQMGWVENPHPYCRPTRQLALRWKKGEDKWHYRILVFNLTDQMLFQLGHHADTPGYQTEALLAAIVDAYDFRGGGVETSIKGSKSGLRVHRRNKRSFAAQEMLILLAQLAYNLICWAVSWLAKGSTIISKLGKLRIIRDVFQIPGKVRMNEQGEILSIILNRNHPLAKTFCEAFQFLLPPNTLSLILHQI